MTDLIKREDAIKAVENVSENYTKEGDREWHPHIDFITQALVQVPSAEKQGEWIGNGDCEYLCSECGMSLLFEPHYNFCPDCGARMVK